MRIITLLSPATAALAALAFLTPALSAQEALPSAEEALALVQNGQAEEALAAWQKRAEANETDGQAQFYYAYCLHMAGDLDRAHDAHIAAARFPQFTVNALYNHACVHSLRNEPDAAFLALDEAIEAGFSSVEQLETDTDLDNIRADGRFEAIVLKLSGTAPTSIAKLPAARRFDFYLGRWDMRNGETIERNLSVESAYGGSGLSAVSVDAKTGEAFANSLFVYDADDAVWRQVYMQKSGLIVVLEGGRDGDAMILRQKSIDGESATNERSVFKDITPTSFKYEWQRTADDGKTWETLATRSFTRS